MSTTIKSKDDAILYCIRIHKVTSSGKLMHNHKEDGSFHFLSHLDVDRPIIKLSLQDSLGQMTLEQV